MYQNYCPLVFLPFIIAINQFKTSCFKHAVCQWSGASFTWSKWPKNKVNWLVQNRCPEFIENPSTQNCTETRKHLVIIIVNFRIFHGQQDLFLLVLKRVTLLNQRPMLNYLCINITVYINSLIYLWFNSCICPVEPKILFPSVRWKVNRFYNLVIWSYFKRRLREG